MTRRAALALLAVTFLALACSGDGDSGEASAAGTESSLGALLEPGDERHVDPPAARPPATHADVDQHEPAQHAEHETERRDEEPEVEPLGEVEGLLEDLAEGRGRAVPAHEAAFEELPVEERDQVRRRFWESYLERLARDSDPILEELAAAGIRPGILEGAFEHVVENPDVVFPAEDTDPPPASELEAIREELDR